MAHRFNRISVNQSISRRPERAVLTVTNVAGHMIGRIEGNGGHWRAWTWAENAGEWRAVPGSYPSEASARTALAWRAAP